MKFFKFEFFSQMNLFRDECVERKTSLARRTYELAWWSDGGIRVKGLHMLVLQFIIFIEIVLVCPAVWTKWFKNYWFEL